MTYLIKLVKIKWTVFFLHFQIQFFIFSFFCIHFLFILRIFDFEFLKNKENRTGKDRKEGGRRNKPTVNKFRIG